MPGDLIMDFSSEVNHPEARDEIIHRNYILIGIVKSFVYEEWDTGKTDC